MHRIVAALTVLTLVGACGLRTGPGPGPTPTAPPKRALATGLEALALAKRRVPSAMGLVRVSVSFPRPNGTAEFWTITLFDPASPTSYSEVSIQGKETVETRSVPANAEVVPVGLEVLKEDTSSAEKIVRKLDWASKATFEVLLNPIALDLSGEGSPGEVKGRPAWQFVVTEQTEGGPRLVGTAWISAEFGHVVASRTA